MNKLDKRIVSQAIGEGLVRGVDDANSNTFGAIKKGKAAVVDFFETGNAMHESECKRLGIKPNITGMSYASAGIAKGVLSLVPETPGEVVATATVPVVAEKALSGGMLLYHGMKKGKNVGKAAVGGKALQYTEKAILNDFKKMDLFPTKGFKGGDLYPAEKRLQLYRYLQDRGADIQPIPIGGKGPGFMIKDPITKKPTLYLPENPTVLEVKHELSHYLDYKKLGPERYDKLTRYEKEKMVLDRLKTNRDWASGGKFNAEEKKFSEKYVAKVKTEDSISNVNGGPDVK